MKTSLFKELFANLNTLFLLALLCFFSHLAGHLPKMMTPTQVQMLKSQMIYL